MSETKLKERVGWLGLLLTNQRNNLADLLLRLRDVGLRAGSSLAIHRKFLKMLEQVEVERERELGLLHEIEEVEKKHAEMRRLRKLRTANDSTPAPKDDETHEFTPKPTATGDRKWGLWVWLLLWWWFMSRMRRALNITPSPK
jgi:hypothetical protein